MAVTVGNVLAQAADRLGDKAQQVFSNSLLLRHFPEAYREYVGLMASLGDAKGRREAWIHVPAGNSHVRLDDYDVDFQQVVEVGERTSLGQWTITNVVVNPATLVLTTSSSHGRSVGDVIQLGALPALNGARGPVAVSSVGGATTLTVSLAGVTGTWSGTGTYSYGGTQKLQPVDLRWSGGPYSLPLGEKATDRISAVVLDDLGGLRFTPCTGDRQLRVIVLTDGDDLSSINDLIGWDQSRDFLAYSTALRASESEGITEDMQQQLRIRLYGPGGSEGYVTGGLALRLKRDAAKVKQTQRIIRPPFRPVHTALRYRPFF